MIIKDNIFSGTLKMSYRWLSKKIFALQKIFYRSQKEKNLLTRRSDFHLFFTT